MISAGPSRHVLDFLRERVDWGRSGALLAIVTLGFSEIIFRLILQNLDYFPGAGWFYVWVVIWVQVLPFLALFGIESALVRWGGKGWVFRIWRALLYTALFLSLLRQAQVHYPDPFWAVMSRIPLLPVVFALTLLVFLLCLRSRLVLHQYIAWLGCLAAALMLRFILFSGTLSASWSGEGGNPDLPAATPNAPDIYLLLFDELSYDILVGEDGIDEENFPTIAALASEGAWFTRATTNQFLTREAIPNMLSGYIRPPEGVPTLFDRLPEGYDVVLRLGAMPTYKWIRSHLRQNHRVSSFSWSEWIARHPLEIPPYLALSLSETPYGQSPFSAQKTTRLLPPILWGGKKVPMEYDADIEALLKDAAQESDRPRMIFWHSYLPHHPFALDAEGREHGRPHTLFAKAPRAGREPSDPATYTTDAVLDNYRDQVRFVDRILARFVDTLKKRGTYENSLVIVTSDHGLRTWGELEPADYPRSLRSWTPNVPLLIFGPRVPAGRYAVDYQHTDLIATILDVLGYPDAANDTEGVSAFSPKRPERDKILENHQSISNPIRYRFDAGSNLWRQVKPQP